MWIKKIVSVQELIAEAFEARRQAYAPYSGYRVGACVLCENDRMYRGCNIENASYGATNCAERTAVFKAVSEGNRKITAVAIVGGTDEEEKVMSDYAFPCGVCRQVLREFSDPAQLQVIVARSTEDYRTYTLEQLLPESFGPDHLKQEMK